MNTARQPGTFISYSRTNKEFALDFARELKSTGYSIWLDQLDIPTGARWDDEVERALHESEIFLIILTPTSVTSENVKDEIGYAIDHGKHILPVLLEKCDIPLRLRRFQYVDFTEIEFSEGIRKAKQLLEDLLNKQFNPVVTTSPEFERQKAFGRETITAHPSPKQKKPVQSRWVRIGAGILLFAACLGLLRAMILSRVLSFSGIATRTPTVSETLLMPATELPTNTPPPEKIPISTVPTTEGYQTPNYKPMWESSAIITDLNDTQTTVPADSLRWCISVGEAISLENGYTIALDSIKRIDIIRAAPAGGKTLFSITLLDDTKIEGEALTCSFLGQTSLGRFELWTNQIQSVEILR